MSKEESIKIVENGLKKYGANVYDYRGTKFIGIKNPCSDNNMAITFGETEMTMEFTYQSARFAYGNEGDLITHAEKYLTGKLVSAEFFLGGKPLFGGSRESGGAKFKTTQEMLVWYTGGNEKIADNLRGFLKNDGVTLKIRSWDGSLDREILFGDDKKS